MGVYGLLSHCLEHRVECAEYADLVEIAVQRDGIELLVDFYAFEHYVLKNFWKSLGHCSNNPYLRMLGGNYGALDAFVSKLVKDLKSLNIHLVMFVDGAKGSSRVVTEQKLETWKFRHARDLKKLQEVLDVAHGNRQIRDLSNDSWVRPVLLEVQIFETLKACECEVVSLSSGEADYVIARNFRDRPKAYAILSNDSDFCIFKDCRFIPYELFDANEDLQLGSTLQWLPDKPIRLMCGSVSPSSLASLFEFTDEAMLVELSILSGNDFTTQHVRYLKDKVGLQSRGGKITDVAEWVKKHRRVENHPFIGKEMQRNRALRSSVERSREFYKMTLPSDTVNFKGHLSQFLDEGIQSGKFANNVMSMHYNFYWHRMLLEDTSRGAAGVEMALGSLRSFIYKIVLHPNEHGVVEYGRTPYEDFATNEVYAVNDRRIRTADEINDQKIFHNLRTFNLILLHHEPHYNLNFFDKYGRRNGFNILVLRYMYVLNLNRHLHLQLDELVALVACLFCKVDEPWYTGLALMPDVRCFTVASWYQDIYRHAYSFLGKLLHITHEFPQPKEVYRGAVFTAFYMVMMHEGMLRTFQFPEDWLGRIKHDLNYIIGEKRHVIKGLLDGIQDFNTNFRFYVR